VIGRASGRHDPALAPDNQPGWGFRRASWSAYAPTPRYLGFSAASSRRGRRLHVLTEMTGSFARVAGYSEDCVNPAGPPPNRNVPHFFNGGWPTDATETLRTRFDRQLSRVSPDIRCWFRWCLKQFGGSRLTKKRAGQNHNRGARCSRYSHVRGLITLPARYRLKRFHQALSSPWHCRISAKAF